MKTVWENEKNWIGYMILAILGLTIIFSCLGYSRVTTEIRLLQNDVNGIHPELINIRGVK